MTSLALHVCGGRRLASYLVTGFIRPPVHFWSSLEGALRWARRFGRRFVLLLRVTLRFALTDHRPRGQAWWSPVPAQIVGAVVTQGRAVSAGPESEPGWGIPAVAQKAGVVVGECDALHAITTRGGGEAEERGDRHRRTFIGRDELRGALGAAWPPDKRGGQL